MSSGLIVCSVISAILVILIASSFYFYHVGFVRQEKTFLLNNPDLEMPQTADGPALETPWVDRQLFENVEMMSHDGLRLHGYYLQAKQSTTKTVLLAHGYAGSAKENMGLLAQLYHETLGFNILMPDSRGHGMSEGGYIGFGWHDRLDYIKWISFARQRTGADAQIVLHGISMGGSTVLMVAGEKLPDEVKCIIADCAYTSAFDILAYQSKRMYKVSLAFLIPLVSLVCKLRAGYFIGEASALRQVEKTTKPILFIHGDADTFVPTAMVYPLYEACKGEKDLLIVPGAGHGLAYVEDKVGYAQKTQEFLAKYIQ